MNYLEALYIVIELAEQNILAEWDASDTTLTKEIRRQEQAIRLARQMVVMFGGRP